MPRKDFVNNESMLCSYTQRKDLKKKQIFKSSVISYNHTGKSLSETCVFSSLCMSHVFPARNIFSITLFTFDTKNKWLNRFEIDCFVLTIRDRKIDDDISANQSTERSFTVAS